MIDRSVIDPYGEENWDDDELDVYKKPTVIVIEHRLVEGRFAPKKSLKSRYSEATIGNFFSAISSTGPKNVPVVINSVKEFNDFFGSPDKEKEQSRPSSPRRRKRKNI